MMKKLMNRLKKIIEKKGRRARVFSKKNLKMIKRIMSNKIIIGLVIYTLKKEKKKMQSIEKLKMTMITE